MRQLLLSLVLVLAVASCGKKPTGGNENPTNPPGGDGGGGGGGGGSHKKYNLTVFSGVYCSVCKQKLPETQGLMVSELGDLKANVNGTVFVTNGDPASQHPTQEMADGYRDKYLPGFQAKPDAWRCKTYKDMLGDASCELPAAVVTTEDGTVITKVVGNQFVPANLVALLKEKLNE